MNKDIKKEKIDRYPLVPKKKNPQIISSLTAAFLDYPIFSDVLFNTSSRYHKLQEWVKMVVRYAHKFASIYSTSENCEGSIVFVDTTYHDKETIWRWILAGYFRLRFKWNKEELKKYENIITQIDRLRKKNVPPDHIYIMLLGVNPSFQKQGHARKLLNLAISRSKEKKIPLYLETFKPINEGIYQKFGFKTMEKYPIPNSKLILYSMLRNY